MEFRDLKKQYQVLREAIDREVGQVLRDANYISGGQVFELERQLADYVGVKHCVTCANGTDALELALMAWGIGPGDAVFVPDFTFFSSAEVIASVGAAPIFVDVCRETFNISPASLEQAVKAVAEEGKLLPKAVIAVDLFGLPASYREIHKIAEQYQMLVLEDGAQGFGGEIAGKRACSFGDISTTSFFPAKPLGCYGDGGAIFTDSDTVCEKLQSLKVHGKGKDKYDNVSIGKNSRLDTLQAAVLLVKLKAFAESELRAVNRVAERYDRLLAGACCHLPSVPQGMLSSWAQYTILLENERQRDLLQRKLREEDIPSMIYYKKPMHAQKAFDGLKCYTSLDAASELCDTVLSLPIHPYLEEEDQDRVCGAVRRILESMP